mgnify:CR=1 FL=1
MRRERGVGCRGRSERGRDNKHEDVGGDDGVAIEDVFEAQRGVQRAWGQHRQVGEQICDAAVPVASRRRARVRLSSRSPTA